LNEEKKNEKNIEDQKHLILHVGIMLDVIDVKTIEPIVYAKQNKKQKKNIKSGKMKKLEN
jgi:hypothetical protein